MCTILYRVKELSSKREKKGKEEAEEKEETEREREREREREISISRVVIAPDQSSGRESRGTSACWLTA